MHHSVGIDGRSVIAVCGLVINHFHGVDCMSVLDVHCSSEARLCFALTQLCTFDLDLRLGR